MKQAWNDLKSFITVSMIFLLFIIVIANVLGFCITENILVLVTNLITAVFTYYFTKERTALEETKNTKEDETKKDIESEEK